MKCFDATHWLTEGPQGMTSQDANGIKSRERNFQFSRQGHKKFEEIF